MMEGDIAGGVGDPKGPLCWGPTAARPVSRAGLQGKGLMSQCKCVSCLQWLIPIACHENKEGVTLSFRRSLGVQTVMRPLRPLPQAVAGSVGFRQPQPPRGAPLAEDARRAGVLLEPGPKGSGPGCAWGGTRGEPAGQAGGECLEEQEAARSPAPQASILSHNHVLAAGIWVWTDQALSSHSRHSLRGADKSQVKMYSMGL